MRVIAILGAVLGLGTALAAQSSASSSTWFLSSIELASGEEQDTLLYKLRPQQGAGLVAHPCAMSATYVLEGGFPAALDATVLGSPWLTGVRPYYVPQRGSPTLTLHGTELNLGPTPIVTVGGQPATVGVRANSQLQITMPDQPVPGYQPVLVTSVFGNTILTEGVGVLPMIELLCPMLSDTPNGLRIRGTQNDVMVLAMSFGLAGSPFALPPYGYSFQLDFGLLVLSSGFVLSGGDTLDLIVPPLALTGLIYVQTFTFSSSNPGYAPGSFSNVVRI
ncbi:MAG: hypothetical protein IT457_11250 [Planctomycetes bacterium]|nr:hypothetical protein [Planctomycetota bacterium]